MPDLGLPYSKHLGAAYRAHTLGCRLTILHGYHLSVLHLLTLGVMLLLSGMAASCVVKDSPAPGCINTCLGVRRLEAALARA